MNPMEQSYPDAVILDTVTIKARRTENGTWLLCCPEWRFEAPVGNLTKAVAMLAADIENHNAEVQKEAWRGEERRKCADYVGRKFGAMTVLEIVGKDLNSNPSVRVHCAGCGKDHVKRLWNVVSGRVTTCGCGRTRAHFRKCR